MDNINFYRQVVIESIRHTGLDPEKCKGKEENEWCFRKGSAEIILILHNIKKGEVYFSAMVKIMQIPNSNEKELFQELLKLNQGMVGAWFAIKGNMIIIKSTREAAGMNSIEGYQIIQHIGNCADHFDDILKNNFPYTESIGFK